MPTQQGKEPATSLPTASIFRGSLVSVLCWRLWPGPEQPGRGDLLHGWTAWGHRLAYSSCSAIVPLLSAVKLQAPSPADWGLSTPRAQCICPRLSWGSGIFHRHQ